MKLSQQISYCLAIPIALSFSGCVTFEDGPAIRSGEFKVKTEDGYIRAFFSDRDRETISNYYVKKGKHKKSPPGLAKRNALPPGLRKRLDAGKRLPRGLQGRNLPDDLEYILSPLPKEYIRLIVGGDIIIMNKNTEVVVDIIQDICW